MADIEVIKEFLDVFPEELLGLPLVREIDFTIELLPRSLLIFIVLYKMALVELVELKKQL